MENCHLKINIILPRDKDTFSVSFFICICSINFTRSSTNSFGEIILSSEKLFDCKLLKLSMVEFTFFGSISSGRFLGNSNLFLFFCVPTSLFSKSIEVSEN